MADTKKDRIIVPLLFLFAAVVWRSPYYVLSLYVAIPLFIAYCFWHYFADISKCKYWKPYLFLIVWMLLSCAINPESDASFRRMIPITASFLLAFSTYSIAKNSRHTWILYVSYIALLFYLLYSNITANEDFVASFDYSNEAERGKNMKLNANDYAYYLLFASMAIKLLMENYLTNIKYLWKLLLYAVFLILSFYIALMTASRQVLTLQIPLFVFFFFYDFFLTKKKGSSLAVIVMLVGIIVALPIVVEMYSNSYLAVRSQVSFQDDVRSSLLKRAMEQGYENPIIGLGLGADTFFSHCTYTHLFARVGAPALIAFLLIVIPSAWEQLKKFRRYGDYFFFLCFVLLSFIAIGHFLYSYIDEPFMMSIAFLIIGQSEGREKMINYHG